MVQAQLGFDPHNVGICIGEFILKLSASDRDQTQCSQGAVTAPGQVVISLAQARTCCEAFCVPGMEAATDFGALGGGLH